MKKLEEKLVADIGDIVWFLRPQFTEIDEEGCTKVYFLNQIEQGRVVNISAATDCAATINVVDINNSRVGVIQEVFFKSFDIALIALETVKGVFFNNMGEYIKAVESFVVYEYIVRCPYEVSDEIEVTYNGVNYLSKVHRFLFDKSDSCHIRTPWANRTEVQLIIEELKLVVSRSNLDKLINVDVEKNTIS